MKGEISEEFLISQPDTIGVRKYPAVAFSPKSDNFVVLWQDGRKPLEGGRRIFGAVR